MTNGVKKHTFSGERNEVKREVVKNHQLALKKINEHIARLSKTYKNINFVNDIVFKEDIIPMVLPKK